jgi:hypothetical protein
MIYNEHGYLKLSSKHKFSQTDSHKESFIYQYMYQKCYYNYTRHVPECQGDMGFKFSEIFLFLRSVPNIF